MKIEKFNNNWKFWEEINSFALVWSIPENARDITLPHDAMVERRARADSPNGGCTGYKDGGNYVYVKRFYAPEEWKDKTIFLKFDGIYCNSLVYLNGQFLASQPYGYSVFKVFLNDKLHYGRENELRVLVKNNAMPNSRWYSGSGIYRDVHLLSAETVYIPDGSLKLATESLDNDTATVSIQFSVHNRRTSAEKLKAEIRIFSPDGLCVATDTLPLFLSPGFDGSFKHRLHVESPLCWSDTSPNLYRCEIHLLQEERELDLASDFFGIRTLSLSSRKGLLVNGQSAKLKGACIHHDHGILGAACYYDAEYRRIKKLKEAGFNAIRMSHHPAAPVLLRVCDELGMYVMDEAFDMWSRPKKDNDYSLYIQQWWRSDLKSMIEKDFNHPSVIFFSLGNEIPEIAGAQGMAFSREMVRFVNELDPTRFTLAAVNGVFSAGDSIGAIMADILSNAPHDDNDGDVNDFMTAMDKHMDDIVRHPIISGLLENISGNFDILGYNYMGSRYESDALEYPQRIMIGSETSPPEITRNWPLVKKLPSLIGDFTWTGWDYLGEAGLGIPAYTFGEGGFGAMYPCQLAYCGDMDITGFRRPLSYLRELVFGLRKAPYIAVQLPSRYGQPLIKTPWILSDTVSCWSWPGFEGKPVIVEVYSDGDEVELLCNGISLGRKPAGEETGYIACFETEYIPGKLEAVSFCRGKIIGKTCLSTAEGPLFLSAQAEPLPDNSKDNLIFINLTISDENGVCAPYMDDKLSIVSSDNLEILGFGSGDPKPLYNYLDTTVTTYNGRAQAIARKKDPLLPGKIIFQSSSGNTTLCV